MHDTQRLAVHPSPALNATQRLQAIFDSAVDFAIIATDRDGRVTDWNYGAEQVLGWSTGEMRGYTVERIFTPEDRVIDRADAEMRLALEDGRASDERWHMRRDGTRFWASGEMMPLRDEQGTHVGFLKILRDRTAEHEAGKALREMEGDLQRAQVAGRVGVFTVNTTDDVLRVTPEFCRIFGLPVADHYPAATVERLVLPEDASLRSSAASRADGTAVADVEYRIRRASDDAVRWIERRAEIERDAAGASVRFCGVVRDVTEQREATDALARIEARARENSQRVQLALEAGAIIGTWFWDLPSDRFTVDEAFAAAFGLDPALGREGIPLAQIVATVHPDDQAGLAAAIDGAITRGGRYAHQYRVRRRDGRYHWLEANGLVEHGPDGTPLRFPGVLIDVASRRFDAALGELSERLRNLDTPQEMASAAVETVGQVLDLSRAAYGDVDAAAQHVVIRPDWLAEGQPSIAGTHDFKTYGSYVEELRRGEDVIIDDVVTDSRTADRSESFEAIDTRALVNLPLMDRGHLKVVFCLNHRDPHRWSPDELTFARRVMDRTEVEIARRAAERELRTNEARQRQLLQQMPGFVGVLTGPDHVFDYVNDAYVAISGPRDFVGRGVREVFPELEGQGFFEQLDRVYATGVPFAAKGVPVRIAREGAERFIDHMYQPIRDDAGTVTGIFVGGYDVTEQQRSAAALRDLNADLEREVTERALARGRTWQVSPDLLVVIDGRGFFETVNPAWTVLLDWSEHELTRVPFVAFVHPDDLAATQAVWVDAIARGLPVIRFENRYRHKDGGWRWLSWVGVPDDGKVYCSARDVTADKGQAAALLQAEDALRQSQKMEAVGQLTGGVAHDFNNLLTVIKSSTDLLKRPNLAEERRARYVAAISDTVDRAAKLTGQLLAFARRQALKPEVFAVCDSVRALSDMMGTLTGSRIRISTDLSDAPSFVEVDPSQFDTALVNLAVNARDAMDGEGRITVAVRTVDAIPAVRAHPVREGAYVAVSLSDTGSGMPADRIERIFEPFFTTKGVGKGTGLGLSQVFGFVKQSGGDIAVDSVVGEGTTFTLYLPRVSEPKLVAAVEEPEVLADGHGTRVLVVEDNVDVGAFAVQTLGDLGYVTVLATDGPSALSELAKDPTRFDVVFSDVMMPGMTGVELGQEIRRLYRDMPVVLTSGYSHVLAQDASHGFELLHKPYSVEQLSQILRKSATWRRRERLGGKQGRAHRESAHPTARGR